MLMKVMVLQDAMLRDIRAEKRQLRWPADARAEEALEHNEVSRINEIHKDVEDAHADLTGDPVIVVRTFLWFGRNNEWPTSKDR